MNNYYTPEELAEQFKLHRMTIYRLLRTGRIPSIRIGKSYRIPAGPLQTWLSSQTGKTPSEPVIPGVVEEFISLLRQTPRSFQDKISHLILFGSYARGTPNENSDVDLLVLVKDWNNAAEDLLLDLVSDAELKVEDDIALLTKSMGEWERMGQAGSVFYRTILKEGHTLWPKKMPTKRLTEIEPLKK